MIIIIGNTKMLSTYHRSRLNCTLKIDANPSDLLLSPYWGKIRVPFLYSPFLAVGTVFIFINTDLHPHKMDDASGYHNNQRSSDCSASVFPIEIPDVWALFFSRDWLYISTPLIGPISPDQRIVKSPTLRNARFGTNSFICLGWNEKSEK